MSKSERPKLPRPDVKAEGNGPGVVDVVISRDGKAKSYRGNASTTDGAVADVVRKILDDPHTAEWLP